MDFLDRGRNKATKHWQFCFVFNGEFNVLLFSSSFSPNVFVVVVVIRNDKDNTPGIRRVSSQGGSLNRGLQSWGTGPPPLPREPPPQEEPTPPPKTPK